MCVCVCVFVCVCVRVCVRVCVSILTYVCAVIVYYCVCATPIHAAQRLNCIEMEFSSRHSSDMTSVDERLSLHQRRCEEWAKQQVKLEVLLVYII